MIRIRLPDIGRVFVLIERLLENQLVDAGFLLDLRVGENWDGFAKRKNENEKDGDQRRIGGDLDDFLTQELPKP